MLLYGKNELTERFSGDNEIYEILKFAEKYGIEGNLNKAKIAWLLMNDENPFSLSSERNGDEGSVSLVAKKDIAEIRKLFFANSEQALLDYKPLNKNISGEEKRIGKAITKFLEKLDNTKSDEEFFLCVKNYYLENGVGDFGINKAFYMQDNGNLVPVSHIREVGFEELWGYESQQEKLVGNTRAFANGKTANNVLLYGDSGTGKSTSIKAIVNLF